MNKEYFVSILSSIFRVPSFIYSFIGQKKNNGIVLIGESHGWVIDDINKTISGALKKTFKFSIDLLPFFYSNKIIHYGSLNSISKKKHRFNGANNKIIVTVHHIDFLNNKYHSKIFFLKEILDRVSKIIVPNTSLYEWFVQNEFPVNKLLLIPIAYDDRSFKIKAKFKYKDLNLLKEKYRLPKDKFIIGSFQKDGNGWGAGMSPKLIKGPDVLVSVAKEISKKIDVCLLLTGPSRGYVISELKKNNIDYVHINANKKQLEELYVCLDVYLITSRIEGGPKGLMESMAVGVPVVSTKVGMAQDLIKNDNNGILADIGDIQGLSDGLYKIYTDFRFRNKVIENSFNIIYDYSWRSVIGQYKAMYDSLINDN